MRICILGTAAAEGIPAVFCDCRVCRHAMQAGGKNVRTRSQVLINDDLLIDINADTYAHKLRYGLRLEKLKTVLVTHSHTDHFYPFDLALRGMYYAPNVTEPLKIICNRETKAYFDAADKIEPFGARVKELLDFEAAAPFQTYSVHGYEVHTLAAKHTSPEKALLYVIERDGKTLFHCYDTARLPEETLLYLQNHGCAADAILIDGTSGKRTVGPEGVHMGLPDCRSEVEKMRNLGILKKDCQVIITHISHNGGYTHEEYEAAASSFGYRVAYDGMRIEI